MRDMCSIDGEINAWNFCMENQMKTDYLGDLGYSLEDSIKVGHKDIDYWNKN